jgi:hypothetical protein
MKFQVAVGLCALWQTSWFGYVLANKVAQIVSMYAVANPYSGGGWESSLEDSSATLTRTDEGIGFVP